MENHNRQVVEQPSVSDELKLLREHSRLLETHATELQLHAQKILVLENNSMRLENLVMTENRETRQTIINTNNQLHDLIKSIVGTNSKLSVTKWESVVKIIVAIAGSGGLLYYIFN